MVVGADAHGDLKVGGLLDGLHDLMAGLGRVKTDRCAQNDVAESLTARDEIDRVLAHRLPPHLAHFVLEGNAVGFGVDIVQTEAQHVAAGQIESERVGSLHGVEQRLHRVENQLVQEQLARQHVGLLVGLAHLVFGQTLFCLVQRREQTVLRGRFEHKINHTVVDGLLGVGKVWEAGQDDDLAGRMVLADPPSKLQTVHLGHTDI